jgi:hypothetical protein
MTNVIREMLGTTPEVEQAMKDAGRVLSEPLAQLDRSGTLTDSARDALIHGPRAGCLMILGKMDNGQPYAQQPLHEVLVAMNDGHDLGATADAWIPWCQQRVGITPPAR